jgi:hypothetical protein
MWLSTRLCSHKYTCCIVASLCRCCRLHSGQRFRPNADTLAVEYTPASTYCHCYECDGGAGIIKQLVIVLHLKGCFCALPCSHTSTTIGASVVDRGTPMAARV